MNILVCIKQILDPEISPRDFQIDQDKKTAAAGNANFVTNIFCENAVESALQLREKTGGEITALSFGSESAEDALRKALALKIDHACRIDNPGIAHAGSDGAAFVLAAAIRKLSDSKLGDFDLIMLGREAGDWGEGRTAGMLAEQLELPFISFVDAIERKDGTLQLGRQTDFGREELTASTPLVISITNNDTNVPRIPKTRDIMKAHRKDLTTWALSDIGLDEDAVRAASAQTEIIELSLPEKQGDCQYAEGESAEEKVAAFAKLIAGTLSQV